MKRKHILLSLILSLLLSGYINAQQKTVVIETNVGTMKGILYEDVPNHVKTFIQKAKQGDFNGTLFTRVVPEFIIQGGSADSRNAPAGTRIGYGDRSSEIMPELRPNHFHKKGALAAPRQNDDVNPQKKSDISQFFIVQGKTYSAGELDTLERATNRPYRQKAQAEFYEPVRVELQMLKNSNRREYNKRMNVIYDKIDSVIQSSPGHLLFTEQQREAYTSIGGAPNLDGVYTIYGEITEGLDIIDIIANQARDSNDRPKKDIRIIQIKIE